MNELIPAAPQSDADNINARIGKRQAGIISASRWQCIHGRTPSCWRDIPDGSLAGIITDPPYCSGGFIAARKAATGRKYLSSNDTTAINSFDGDSMTDAVFQKFSVDWLEVAAAKVGNGVIFICIDWRMVGVLTEAVQIAGWKLLNVLIWDKNNGRPRRNGYGGSYEMIIHASIGAPHYHRPDICVPKSVLRYNPVKLHKIHHTEKPVPLIMDILRFIPDDGRPVMDPFAGSGATMEAALRHGMDSVGVESNAAFCDTIAARLPTANRADVIAATAGYRTPPHIEKQYNDRPDLDKDNAVEQEAE